MKELPTLPVNHNCGLNCSNRNSGFFGFGFIKYLLHSCITLRNVNTALSNIIDCIDENIFLQSRFL